MIDLEEFKKRVKEGKIKNKRYFYRMNEISKQKIVRNMHALIQFFKNKCDIDIYLIYGTLLGAIREHDFIEHDCDIDFAYLSKETHKRDIIIEYEKIISILKRYDMLSKICRDGHLFISSPNKENKFDLWTSFCIDNKYSLVPIYDNEIDSSIIIPLKTMIFKNYTFLIPNNSEKLLDLIYHNWERPILESRGTKNKWKNIF